MNEYLAGDEGHTRQGLIWGNVVSEPAPAFSHQMIVTRAVILLDQYARDHKAGLVCVSPLDVVLDEGRALVVQPDVVFISHDRAGMLRDQVWGAPDLVVEVESPGTRQRDRTVKMGWYRRYGVRECWLIDPAESSITVTGLEGVRVRRRRFHGQQSIQSTVLPRFTSTAAEFFG